MCGEGGSVTNNFAEQNFLDPGSTVSRLRAQNMSPPFESPRKQSSLLALSPRTKMAPAGAHFCTRGERFEFYKFSTPCHYFVSFLTK